MFSIIEKSEETTFGLTQNSGIIVHDWLYVKWKLKRL